MNHLTRALNCLLLLSLLVAHVHGQALTSLVPTTTATHTAVQSGNWFSGTTWNTGTVPGDAAIVVIPAGITVDYEGQSSAHIFAVRVDGAFHCTQSNASQTTTLTFDTFVATMQSIVRFDAEGPTDGRIEVTIAPFDIEAHKAGLSGYNQAWNAAAMAHYSDGDSTFRVSYSVGPDDRFNSYQDALLGNTTVTETSRVPFSDGPGVLGRYGWDSTQVSLGLMTMGEVEILGREKGHMVRLSADALRNQPVLQLDSVPFGWAVGDSLIVTRGGNLGATSNGEDLVAIQSISAASVTCTADLQKNHEGRLQDDLHCYVGNLSRNIVFRSAVADTIHQRGHFMAMANDSNVVIRNAVFRDMGRTDKSRLLDDFVWDHWLQPRVFKSKISALGQECAKMRRNPPRDITNPRGRYSIHLHKLGSTFLSRIATVTGNVVRGNPGWGITHHDSYADVSRNVVYDVVGSGIVSESGSELGFWDDNLVVDVRQGHTTDLYEAALFHDDYLFSGQGLGMRGRGVYCRGNVIANARQGVGVMNMNPSVDNLDRVDARALATLRPGFQFDQFPLDQNGYSSEGDGILPVEVALLMENTTVIGCYQGLRSIERDMGVNHESRSIFDGYKAWGINQGLSITYQADYSFRDVFISGRNSNAIGAFLWKHSHNHVFDRIKMVDLAYGVTVSKLVENGNNQKTRNNGFTPWIFVDLDTVNVGAFYEIVKEDPNTATIYTEHGDNPIHLSAQDVVSRPTTFTVLDSTELAVDYGNADFRFEVDGIVTDDLGSYDMGIKQAWAQGTLRLDYPQRIYEFASAQKFEEYLQHHGVYKDTSDNDQLYFILNEWLPNRATYQYTPFPVRVKIHNAPATGVFANPQIESPQALAPQLQMVSRKGTVGQSSTDTTITYQGIPIDAGPHKAVDGNNNGRINVQQYQQGLVPVGSFSATETESEPWYDIDLGELTEIEFIDLWNTVLLNGSDIELNAPHFRDFYVLISDTAFGNMGLSQARALADYEFHKDSVASRKYSLNYLQAVGRYVRIQATGINKLSFAEVEIIGRTWIDSTCIPLPMSLQTVTACDSFVWIDGNTYTSSISGVTDTLLSVLGCDSIVTLDLTVVQVNASVTQAGQTLTASPAGATYQWLDCNANQLISGAQAQTFTPTQSGSYAAIVSQNGCTDTTACVPVTVTGVPEGQAPSVALFPNPNDGRFKLQFVGLNEPVEVVVFDAFGKAILRRVVDGRNTVLLNANLAVGLYSAHIRAGDFSRRISFLVTQ